MRTITTSPHFHSGASTQKIMLSVIIALMPSCIWGIFAFGISAFWVLAISVFSSCLTEFLLEKIDHKYTLWDFSAVVTGLLVGMNMPAGIPLFIPALASVFAILVAKWTFGGLGCNWANPAIIGRIFVFFSFTTAMTTFSIPNTLSEVLVSSASPLSLTKTAISSGEVFGMSSFEILASQGYGVSEFASELAAKTGLNPYNIDAFIGNIPGCIGEVSKLSLLIGGIYLVVTKCISWAIPVTYLGSFALLSWIFGGLPNHLGLFAGEVIPAILRGGIFIGAFFMATDMVTCPITNKGMCIFGIGCGFFTFLFRYFGSLPESTSIAILLMNIATPTIDKYCKPKLFGSIDKTKEAFK